MNIPFTLDDKSLEFRWNVMTGRAELQVGQEVVALQSPLNPVAHFSLSLKRTWTCRVGSHEVSIEKIRPLLLAPFRPNRFTIRVDGQTVVEQKGH